jgi:hypothetical protein
VQVNAAQYGGGNLGLFGNFKMMLMGVYILAVLCPRLSGRGRWATDHGAHRRDALWRVGGQSAGTRATNGNDELGQRSDQQSERDYWAWQPFGLNEFEEVCESSRSPPLTSSKLLKTF